VYKDEPCRTCGEVGKITVSGEEFVCPKCRGQKKEQRTAYRWYVSESFTVGNVNVQCVIADGEIYSEFSYMIATSGTVWSGRNIFGSREEAEAACDRLNAAGAPYIDRHQPSIDGMEVDPLFDLDGEQAAE
jgi:hypothetical protein